MKINHRIKIFIALLSLLYLITLVQDTYAKYTSSANANTNITISHWNILVNNQDIKNNSNFTNTIKPVFEDNENIATGVIAPTSKGYFDIIIDGTIKFKSGKTKNSRFVFEQTKRKLSKNNVKYVGINETFTKESILF